VLSHRVEGALMGDAYLNARQAARYLGYEVGDGPVRTDKGVRAFREMCRRHGVKAQHFGRRALFSRAELDAAVSPTNGTAAQDAFARMEALAQQDARGEGRAH
jgi:hypothetical protein